MNRRQALTAAGAGLLGLAAARAGAQAAAYPAKPIRLVVGFTAGGPTDAVGRVLAELLSAKLGQNVVVENRAGANGGVAAQTVMGAAPDGYTLMLGSSGTLSIAPALNDRLPYDPLKDFTCVGLVASYPYLLVAPANSRATDAASLVRAAKATPGTMTYGSAGVGAVNHLAGEWFKSAAGIDLVHVPYKGDSAMVSDLLAGRVDTAFLSIVAARPHVKAGTMRALAIAAAAPTPLGEGLPTLVSLGYPVVAEPWNGVMGPAGMPPDRVRALNGAINEAMQRPETKARLAAAGQSSLTDTPAGFRSRIEQQTAHWAEIIRVAKIPKES